MAWADAIRPQLRGANLPGSGGLLDYGGVERVVATMVEALAMGVLGKAQTCPYLAEVGAVLEARLQ